VLVVNDAYNANPESMAAALRALRTMARGRRSWAVLGAMGELGASADDEHRRVGELAARIGVDRLVVVGPDAAPIAAAARSAAPAPAASRAPADGAPADRVTGGPGWTGETTHVRDVAAALHLLRAELRPGDVVLVKASRAAGLERVALALTEPTAPAGVAR
jgi:UDP-N-acetylmuramoyl-tripeptide--D-alanyl-D-alanine ligase